MPDWTQYVRDRLRIRTLREGREVEIVEDLARQLEDAYREARQSGATDTEALAHAFDRVVFDESLRSLLSTRGLVRASRFSWANTAAAITRELAAASGR